MIIKMCTYEKYIICKMRQVNPYSECQFAKQWGKEGALWWQLCYFINTCTFCALRMCLCKCICLLLLTIGLLSLRQLLYCRHCVRVLIKIKFSVQIVGKNPTSKFILCVTHWTNETLACEYFFFLSKFVILFSIMILNTVDACVAVAERV